MRSLVLAAAAVGLVVPAMAQGSDVHVMTVLLPNGAVQQIQYVGDVPPRVVVAGPFALMQQMMADMDRQMAGLMRVAQGGGMPVAGGCFRSVSITVNGGEAPRVVSQSSGDCGGGGQPAAPAVVAPAPSSGSAGTIEVKGPVYQAPAKGWRG